MTLRIHVLGGKVVAFYGEEPLNLGEDDLVLGLLTPWMDRNNRTSLTTAQITQVTWVGEQAAGGKALRQPTDSEQSRVRQAKSRLRDRLAVVMGEAKTVSLETLLSKAEVDAVLFRIGVQKQDPEQIAAALLLYDNRMFQGYDLPECDARDLIEDMRTRYDALFAYGILALLKEKSSSLNRIVSAKRRCILESAALENSSGLGGEHSRLLQHYDKAMVTAVLQSNPQGVPVSAAGLTQRDIEQLVDNLRADLSDHLADIRTGIRVLDSSTQRLETRMTAQTDHVNSRVDAHMERLRWTTRHVVFFVAIVCIIIIVGSIGSMLQQEKTYKQIQALRAAAEKQKITIDVLGKQITESHALMLGGDGLPIIPAEISRLGAEIPVDTKDPYALGIKAFSTHRFDDARKWLAEANHQNTITETRLAKTQAAVEYYSGHYREAADYYRKALQSTPNDVDILSNLTATLLLSGDKVGAAKEADKAFNLLRSSKNTASLTYASCLNNLACIYQVEAKYPEADSLFKQSIVVLNKLLPTDDGVLVTLGNVVNNLGVDESREGHDDWALTHLNEALKYIKKGIGVRSREGAQTLSNIASVYEEQGKYADAENYDLQALQIRKDLLGETHVETAETYASLGVLYRDYDKLDKALSYNQRALNILTKALGENHPYTLTTRGNIAEIYTTKKEYAKAISMYLQILPWLVKGENADSPDVATLHNNIASCYANEHNYTAAVKESDLAIAIWKKKSGGVDAAVAYNNRGKWAMDQKHWKEAERWFTLALPLYETNFPADPIGKRVRQRLALVRQHLK